MLYVTAIVYLVLALYLYQVVPQTYGVPKKWNYICRSKTEQSNYEDEEDDSQENIIMDFDSRLEDGDS
jgi:hypothetical protein